MEIVGSIVSSIVSSMCGACVKTCINHFKNSDIELKNLKSKIGELKAQEHCIKKELLKEKEKLEGKASKKVVQEWLQEVEVVTKDMDNIDEKFQVKQRYLKSILCNCYSGENSRKHIAEKINEVMDLHEKGKFPNGLVVEGLMLTATTLVGRCAAERTLEMIWASLFDNVVTRIGVHGMGGVGKTTIMKNINNRLLKETTGFDKVIWTTVSKPFNIEKLQNNIAKAVKVEFKKDDDEMRRAGLLLEGLLRSGRYVLILDDLWDEFLLEDVGIPIPSQANGCKIVITTRSLDMCQMMRCKVIKVKLLAEDEAWYLFRDKIGHGVVLTPQVEKVAEQVCKECSCLPLAIVTIGGAMSGVVDITEWRTALTYLTEDVMGKKDEVLEKLKFSYQRLKDEKFQKCLLYCAMYPEDHQIRTKELIGYWITGGLIEKRSRQADLDEGQVILNRLKNTCLLEAGIDWQGNDYVKMHDLIRDMALNITRASLRCMIKAGVELEELPNEEEWTSDLERVSLMENNIKILSCKPKCPSLSVLLLQRNMRLREISDTFFEQMYGLEILDLSETKIKSLPDSLSNLENLRALILYNCYRLGKVPSLAKLNKLSELDLSGTSIEEVPRGLEKLVKLKRLNLSSIGGLKMSDGILPQLTSLQELIIEQSDWEIRGSEELLNFLTKLEIIYVEFCSLSVYNNYVRSLQMPSLHQFHLQLHRDHEYWPDRNRSVWLGEFEVKSEASSLVIPDNTTELSIWKCHDVTRLSQFCFLKNARELEVISIDDCEGLECVLSADEDKEGKYEEDEEIFLQSVQKLQLWNLDNLKNICKEIVPRGFLYSLKNLEIRKCNNMKNPFSHEMFQHNNLQNLQEITIEDCREMEEMIGSRGEEEKEMGDERNSNANSIITLPRLISLQLNNLPKLKSIYRGALFSDSLESIWVIGCRELKRLPIIVVENENTPPQLSTPALKQIYGEEEWWDSVEWNHPNAKTLLQPFFTCW